MERRAHAAAVAVRLNISAPLCLFAGRVGVGYGGVGATSFSLP